MSNTRLAARIRCSVPLRSGIVFLLLVGLVGFLPGKPTQAATPGLPFTEDFADTGLRDGNQTHANWSTEEQALLMAWRRVQFGAFGPGLTGSDIHSDPQYTWDIALGDMDGDGDLDLVAGNDPYNDQTNQLYLNNGTAEPFNGVDGKAIGSDLDQTFAVAIGDLDGDGDLDLVAGNYGSSNRLYLNNGTADPFAGVSGRDISDAHDTQTVALGDVDGDGDLDLVFGNYGEDIRLYLNNGTADPFNGVSGRDIPCDAGVVQSVALGDVDGDGDLDLVTGVQGGQNQLYLNSGMEDPFDGVSSSNIGSEVDSTKDIALGDMDGDGDLDVVAGNWNQTNRAHLNNGSGTPWTPSWTSKLISSDVRATMAVALGDMDGDGDLDVWAGNSFESNRLYLSNGTAEPFTGVSGMDITTDAHDTRSVAIGDLDGDGDLDLVAGNTSTDVSRLYLNESSADPFHGVSGSNITSDAHNTTSVALGDVDGDGQLDVVAGNLAQTNRLYLGGVTASDITGDAQWTSSVALGDVNGDGHLDLVAGNVGLAGDVNRLYLNNGGPNPFSGVSGKNISGDTHQTYAVALGDVNGDGHLDLVAGNWGSTGAVNRLYLNNGGADPFLGVSGSDISSDAHKTTSVALEDVDGDGDLDLVVGNEDQANRLYLNDGSGTPSWTGSDFSADAHRTFSVALGDVNGDGHLDLVVGNRGQANRLYLNNGTDHPFREVGGSNISDDAHDTCGVALGDADGDGDLDLVVGNYDQANRLYLNNGTADPFGGASSSDVTTDAHQTWSVALGDMDGDGALDLVAGNSSSGSGQVNRLYLNSGQPSPTTGFVGSDFGDTDRTKAIALGDVNGDGTLDLVVGNYHSTNRLYLNNGMADPFYGVTGSDVTTDTHKTWSVALGDMDGDGDLDLVAGNGEEANRLYLNNGTADPFGGVMGSNISDDAHGTSSVAVGDVDGDGDLDVVVGNYNQGNRLYLNDGAADPFDGVSGSLISGDSLETCSVALGDVNGDGHLDVVAGNWISANRLYLNDGTADPFGVSGSNITADAHRTYAVALGDLDADGDLDLVVGNDDQANRLYLNDGSDTPSWTGSDIGSDAHDTRTVALGDVDGDGDLDVVAGNYNQANRLYLNNGTSSPFSGVSGAEITPDTHYTNAMPLGDLDGDGLLDLVAGNSGIASGSDQVNRLYQRRLYHTALGRATSLTVDTVSGNIPDAALAPIHDLPANTWVDYWLSNNGGAHWYLVKPGVRFGFPTAGSDLHWRAELHSLSPVKTPRISQIVITSDMPDLSASKANSVGGVAAPGGSWQWTITISNTGSFEASFAAGQTLFRDDLPAASTGYSAATVQNATGITNPDNIQCSIDGSDLTCAAIGGPVTLGATGGAFDVVLTATPQVLGSFDNPRSDGVCEVDPDDLVTESDESNNGCSDTVTVVENEPPLARDDAYTTLIDAPLVVPAPGVLGNDTDADGDPLVAIKDSHPAEGALAFSADGSFVYTPTLGYEGAVAFTYHARDDYADSEVATVTIKVRSSWYRVYLPLVRR